MRRGKREGSLERHVVNRKERRRPGAFPSGEYRRDEPRMPIIGVNDVRAPGQAGRARRDRRRRMAERGVTQMIVGPFAIFAIPVKAPGAPEEGAPSGCRIARSRSRAAC